MDQWEWRTGGALLGLGAVFLGITEVLRAKRAHRRRGLAIAGIVLGALGFLTILLLPVTERLRQSANKQMAKRLVGSQVPAFELRQIGGGSNNVQVSSTTLKGSVYILHFGAGPDSLQKLDTFAKKYKNNGMKCYAVVPKNSEGQAFAFARSEGIATPLWVINDNTAEAFHFRYNPEIVLVGRNGIVLGVFFEETFTGGIEDAVKAALQLPPIKEVLHVEPSVA
jgi:hypothetical protein